jgi:hypothetical protein
LRIEPFDDTDSHVGLRGAFDHAARQDEQQPSVSLMGS